MPGSLRNQANTAHYTEGNATLTNGQSFSGPVHDACPGFTRVRASVFQDQAGSLTVHQSNDVTFATDDRITSTTPVVAGTWVGSGDLLIYKRYVRVVCSNTGGVPLTVQGIDLVFTTV